MLYILVLCSVVAECSVSLSVLILDVESFLWKTNINVTDFLSTMSFTVFLLCVYPTPFLFHSSP